MHHVLLRNKNFWQQKSRHPLWAIAVFPQGNYVVSALEVSRLPQPLKIVPKTDTFSICSYYFHFCLARQSVGCLPAVRKPVPQVPAVCLWMSWQKHEPYHHVVAFLSVSNCRLHQVSYYVLNRLPYLYHKSGRTILIYQHRYKRSLRCRNHQTCFRSIGKQPTLCRTKQKRK